MTRFMGMITRPFVDLVRQRLVTHLNDLRFRRTRMATIPGRTGSVTRRVAAMMTVSVVIAGVLSLTSTAAQAAASAPSTSDPWITSAGVQYGEACPDVLFLGVRGSGEAPLGSVSGSTGVDRDNAAYTAQADEALGRPNAAAYHSLGASLPETTRVGFDVIRYPALAVADILPTAGPAHNTAYLSGPQTAGTNLADEIRRVSTECNGSVQFVISGYSAGAWGVHVGIHNLNDSGFPMSQIRAVSLFGDPVHQPKDSFNKYGVANGSIPNVSSFNGIARLSPTWNADKGMPAVAGRTTSYCFTDDLVCNGGSSSGIATGFAMLAGCADAGVVGVDQCSHTGYTTGAIPNDIATFMRSRLSKLSHWPTFAGTTLRSGRSGAVYDQAVAMLNVPSTTGPVSYTATGLPLGLTISPSVTPEAGVHVRARITGTIDLTVNPGLYPVTITASTGIRATHDPSDTSTIATTANVTMRVLKAAESIPGENPVKWKQVATGGSHSCGLTTDGAVYCWGWGVSGQMGDGTKNSSPIPKPVALPGARISSISTGASHSCALADDGAAFCWGLNSSGELGNGTATESLFPVAVNQVVTGPLASISVGVYRTCAVSASGAAYCWGIGANGALGTGSTASVSVPTPVVGLTSGVSAVSTGAWFTCAITTVGDPFCWGENSIGQLGDGTTTNSLTPVPVSGLHAVAEIVAGDGFACARSDAGGAFCWGQNSRGQLGTGTGGNSSVPVSVHGLTTGVSAISSSGGTHSCAITTENAATCWGGDNYSGELGNGTFKNPWVPVSVAALGNSVVAIDSGGVHSCAILNDGSAACWGANRDGQLGNGAAGEPSNLPVAVVTPSR